MAAKNVFTIAPVFSFADTLAAELLRQHEAFPHELAKTVIFLPTRRACKTVQEAFLRQSEGKPLLLPRLISFSSIEDEETQGRLCLLNNMPDLPAAILPLRRRLLLARLIQQRSPQSLNAEKSLFLADALASLLDEAYIEGMPFERLRDLVPDELAVHWQEILKFLEIITDFWPKILQEEGVIDVADRRVRLFQAQARLWRETPPDFPVIAAGSTGSQPATAELLDAIASVKNGKVILPGLDMLLDEKSFNACEPSHPQYNLKQLLKKMGITRADVQPFGGQPPIRQERLRLISEAMRPSATTDLWRTAEPFTKEAVEGIEKIDCSSVQEEALTIALILRQTLEMPGKTAALITPNRALARRVAAEMNRWGIVMDDSGGTNLTLTEPGSFLLLLGQAALNNWTPVELLSCLKHPLALGGKDFASFRSQVRTLELKALRGQRLGDGFDGLKAAAQTAQETDLMPFVQDLENRLSAFSALMNAEESYAFEAFLDAHLAAAENLAESADRTGAQRLWSGDAGETAAAFLTELKGQSALIEKLTAAEYLSLLAALFKGVTVRPKYGMHSRLDILGTMEARLIQPDVLIMGGLNEGVWPKTPDADPWLSRPMREQCGLSSPERKIALSAHDFAQGFCAKRLIMTRSVKEGGTPSVPSRWLMRLETVLDISGLRFEAGPWSAWAAKTDEPGAVLSFLPPNPRPPVSARPRRLSVTKIETLMRDPYSIYARYILGLKKLDDLNQELDLSDYGTIVHKTVELFCRQYPSDLPVDAEQKIQELGLKLFKELNFSQTAAAFWKPRLIAALKWFVDRQKQRIDRIGTVFCEQSGELTFQAKNGPFTLRCIADRIDLMKDGSVSLIDYKTGLLPNEKTVLAGYSPQLPLEAAIFAHNGFEKIPSEEITVLEYWRLRGQQDGGKIVPLKAEPASLAQEALDRLIDLINTYDDEKTPYLATPDTSVSLTYNDYDHLARFDEWATSDSSEEEGEA
ncbi:MAG: double-strand break repair protein AddB [Alphaproteobacteria bacterium]|nr:double-strand break repair protein AddB [Alphaproteobacteria bacterium]